MCAFSMRPLPSVQDGFNTLQNYSNCSWYLSFRRHKLLDLDENMFYMCFASFRYLLLQGSYDVATYVLGQVSGLYLRHTWMCIFIAVITNWVLILVINLSKSAEPWLCLRRILLFLNGRITPYHIRRLDLDSIPVHSLVILRCWTLT